MLYAQRAQKTGKILWLETLFIAALGGQEGPFD